MNPYDPSAVPGTLHSIQSSARNNAEDRMVLADWYEEVGDNVLSDSTRNLHGLYRPDYKTMAEIM
jgi:hypothetical protein